MKNLINNLNLGFVAIIILLITVACEEEKNDTTNNNTPNVEEDSLKVNWAFALGSSLSDDFAGSIMDNQGNLYFTASIEPDGYAADIVICKINLETQSLMWTKTFDAGDQDYFPSPSENGHSQGGGGSRCIDIDENNNLYITGTSRNGFNKVFVVKLNSSGQKQWEVFWAADNSGLARSNAKAYALEVSSGKVHIVGTTGAGVATEEAYTFLLTLHQSDGSLDSTATHAIDISPGYNDRAYTIKSINSDLYIAGWEGNNNSGFLMKMLHYGKNISWIKRINIGTACRLTDLDADSENNLYVAADLRGVSTYLGVLKIDSAGNYIWGKKLQGESNDRNNVSVVRVIDSLVYVGGRGSFTNYDVSQFGDGTLLAYDFNGNKKFIYNYYVESIDDHCGERIEGIFLYEDRLILAGETWPEFSKIDGNWFEPVSNISELSVNSSFATYSEQIPFYGAFIQNMSFSENSANWALSPLSDGTNGSADVIIFNLSLPN